MHFKKLLHINDFKKIIFKYIFNRCRSCFKKLNNDKNIKKIKYKAYTNDKWRSNESEILKNYCNWCVHYVFEYP